MRWAEQQERAHEGGPTTSVSTTSNHLRMLGNLYSVVYTLRSMWSVWGVVMWYSHQCHVMMTPMSCDIQSPYTHLLCPSCRCGKDASAQTAWHDWCDRSGSPPLPPACSQTSWWGWAQEEAQRSNTGWLRASVKELYKHMHTHNNNNCLHSNAC